jgi:hypothetical protein
MNAGFFRVPVLVLLTGGWAGAAGGEAKTAVRGPSDDGQGPPTYEQPHMGSPATLAAEPAAELVEERKIWEAAPHNAFTDLLRHGDEWFCVFREGSGHVPGTNGVIRVLRSGDGAKWESAALVREAGIDLRDPKLSVTPDGRLMLLMGGTTCAGTEAQEDRPFVRARTRVAFSTDGRGWTSPRPVSIEGQWLWRVTWHGRAGYGFGYSFYVPAKDVSLTLWRTPNGVDYERIVAPRLPAACWPDETTVRFLADDTMVALVRGEQANHHAFIGVSRAPYTQWSWTDAGHAAQGPNFIVVPGERMFYAGRDYPDGARTVLGALTTAGATPLLALPSGGDTSYPGMVWHDGLLWISYYASHEGRAAIYLAKVRVGPMP